MKRSILFSAVAVSFGLGVSTLPSAALPVSTQGVTAAVPGDLVQEARMSRRQRMRRSSGRSSASQGNAGMPSRGRAAQQYGQTSGGPRR